VICDEYARKDGRVRVIHKENEGINATRRRGVHEAAGEWVAFCDDDDTMEPDALESMYALVGGGQRLFQALPSFPTSGCRLTLI
jgi:glycosyltransferase involved in cell wall biosynthesis